MNLLPQPRSVSLTGGRAPWREPDVRTGPGLPPQGYRLVVTPQAVELTAADDAGAFYGRATLTQLRRVTGDSELPCCAIEDWPDLSVRGVMLDVSRDKVPTMQTLEDLIDRLASWKVNQVQLYMEHTFAYSGHQEVWADASPFTAAEIRHLDAFCRERHVELVPNQNCLGHMGRWLKHDRYRRLALFPDGWTERGRWRAPTTIDPATPAPPAPMAGPGSSTPTGATSDTCSTCRSASLASPTGRRWPGASTPTATLTWRRPSTPTPSTIRTASSAAPSSPWATLTEGSSRTC